MLLSQDQEMIRDAVRAYAQEQLWPNAARWDKEHHFPKEAHRGLAALGAIVDECIAYRTVPETTDPTGAIARLAEQGADLITFTSGSTVDHFFELGLAWPDGCVAGSIGPVTSEALGKHGHPPAFEAKPHDIPGLTAAIVKYFRKK